MLYDLFQIPSKIRIKWLIWKGLKLGANCKIARTVLIDPTFPWLIEIGNNCTFSFYVQIIAHDASTKIHTGYSRMGLVKIDDNCFIGAGAIILPNVHIGKNVIVGAGSVVTHDVPDDSIVAGNPARVIKSTKDYIEYHRKELSSFEQFGQAKQRKELLWTDKDRKVGYID